MQTIESVEKKLQDLRTHDNRTSQFRILILELMNHLLIEYVAKTTDIDRKRSLTEFVTELQHCYSILKQLEKNGQNDDTDNIVSSVRDTVMGLITRLRPLIRSMAVAP